MSKRGLSDTEAHDRLCKAAEALGNERGATKPADTALEAARRALVLLQLGLVQAMDQPATGSPPSPSLPE